LFHARGLFRKDFVGNGLPEPARVVGLAEMMEPGGIVHSFGQLQEEDQVLSAQVKLALRAAKVEAPFRRYLTYGVLARVPAMLHPTRSDSQPQRRGVLALPPEEDLAGL